MTRSRRLGTPPSWSLQCLPRSISSALCSFEGKRFARRVGVVSCPVLSCPVLSCPVLYCTVLSCTVLSCPVVSCRVLSCPVIVVIVVIVVAVVAAVAVSRQLHVETLHCCQVDIRQWVLVSDLNPLTIWMFKSAYIRFSASRFAIDSLGDRYCRWHTDE
jgi:hypothetical protein